MKRLLLYFITLIVFSTCTKVKDLSDNVELLDFKISNITPSEVVFGKAVIKDNTVYLSITQGAVYLPVIISGEPVISNNTEQAITGKDFESFENIRFDFDDADLGVGKTFFLVAKNGLPVPYKLRLNLDDVKARVQSIKVNTTGEQAFIAPEGYINPIKRTIKLYTLNESFTNLNLKTAIVVSENSKLKSVDGKSLDVSELDLKFSSISDTVSFILEASNGTEEIWKAFVEKSKDYTGSENAEIKSVISTIGLNATSGTDGVVIKHTDINSEYSVITFSIKNITRTTFENIIINPSWKLSNYAMFTGINKDGILLFNDLNDTIEFRVIDRISGVNKKWKATISEEGVTDVTSFKFNYSDPKAYFKIDSARINNALGIVELIASKSTTHVDYWPVTITPLSINISNGASHNLAISSFNLANINDEKKFTITGYDGRKRDWKIKIVSITSPSSSAYHTIAGITSLESNIGLVIKDFLFPVSSLVSHTTTPYIYIDIPTDAPFPVEISLHFRISPGASMEGFRNGDFIIFNSMKDEFAIKVVAANGASQTWYIRLLRKAQPMNSDFEQWTDAGWIMSLPSLGRGWTSANNSFVSPMTTPIKNENSKYGLAAQLKTSATASDAMGPKHLLTAGSLFLGRFVVKITSLDKPKTMTKFGVPMTASPKAMEIDYKYEPGEKYQYSKLISGTGIASVYQLTDLVGIDSGQIWVQLIHYSGTADLDYDGEWKDRENIKLLGIGEHVCTAVGWNRINIPIVRQADFGKYKPTHVLVTMSSSIKGDFFTGAVGSTLTVDNFEFIYD